MAMVKAEIVVDEEFPVYRIKRMPSWCKTSIDSDLLERYDRLAGEWARLQDELHAMFIDEEEISND